MSRKTKRTKTKKANLKLLGIYFISGLIWLLAAIFHVVCDWSKERYGVGLNELVYTLASPLKGADTSIVSDALQDCLPLVLKKFIPFIFLVFIDAIIRVTIKIIVKIKEKRISINLAYIYRLVVCITSFVFMYRSIMYVDEKYELFNYIEMRRTATTIYENYYVDPEDVDIVLEGEEKNLILIYMESMESTYASVEEGGYQEINYIPNLTKIAQEEISFSDGDKIGGAKPLTGTTWTMGALFASSAGIPFSFPVEGNSMGARKEFASGVTTLGDILEEKGYNQEFLCGSDATFAGRKEFYEQHGDYKVFDYYTAIEEGYIEEDYFVWWGFEDEILYDIAKDEITELAKKNMPFNFTMLTVDTHFVDGYVCELCNDKYDDVAANVISCADCQIAEFIEWCKLQEWYDNTVIVIVGDHKRMDEALVENIEQSEREIYNCFINTKDINVQTANRVFTAIDIFPTIMGAMGYSFEGDRLGLGTNLFSGRQTLAEELGYDILNEEVGKHSNYYIKHFN